MKIHLIWAQDDRGGIGKNNSLPWHISEDLKNFKKLTLSCPIIMGRKTWESLPFKPLPKRRNIIITSHSINDVETYNSIETCIKTLKNDRIEKAFVIGGGMIYNSFYQFADVLHITHVHKNEDGIDTFFPISKDKIQQHFTQVTSASLCTDATYSRWEKLVS